MYIRNDLLNKIKEVFKIKEFTYIGIEKNLSSSEFPYFLLFNTDKNLMAIRKNNYEKGIYQIEIITKSNYLDYYYIHDAKYCSVRVEKNETILIKAFTIFDTIKYKFPGKAFDFEKEFVIAALENEGGDC